MAKKGKGSSRTGIEDRTRESRYDDSIVKTYETLQYIQSIAKSHAEDTLDTIESLQRFLMSWWSKHYNRPLKDPLLLSYTLEELLYEFYNHVERTRVAEERLGDEDDRIEEEVKKENLDWAEQEEQKELEQLKAQAALQEAKKKDQPYEPTDDDVKWMEKQIEDAKGLYGESFGDDIDEDFN